jgi:hypothetical protein
LSALGMRPPRLGCCATASLSLAACDSTTEALAAVDEDEGWGCDSAGALLR